MPAVLKIGYRYFLIKSESAAMAALKALADAIPVEHDYVSKLGDVYYPKDDGREGGIELKIVTARQLRASKPVEGEPEPREVKLLGFNGKVHYSKGADSK